MKNTIIELRAQNQPRVISHVIGLLSRKAVELNGIIFKNTGNDDLLKIFLMINNNDTRHDQVIKQLNKLHDIIDVSIHKGFAQKLFEKIE